MSFRVMRVFVFFDLPTLTLQDRREYRHFRKYLIENGFIQLQESVYCKLALNGVVAKTIMNGVRVHRPPSGLVEMLVVTEKQFTNMEFIVGESNTDIVNSLDKVVFI